MKAFFIALVLIGLPFGASQADTLLLDAIESAPANSNAGVPRPTRGASMSTVEAQYGEPTARKPAVGEPPISRWTYDGYTVFFERDRVIDVVVHR